MRTLEFALAGTDMPERLDQFSVLVEMRDARIAESRRMTFSDEKTAVGRDRHRGGLVEHVRASAFFSCLAERHQHFAIRRKLHHLIPLAVPDVAIDDKDVA